jgi:hypothetical protein
MAGTSTAPQQETAQLSSLTPAATIHKDNGSNRHGPPAKAKQLVLSHLNSAPLNSNSNSRTQLAASCFMLLEDDARVVASKAKAVAEPNLHIALLLLPCTHHCRVDAILWAGYINGGVHPACEERANKAEKTDTTS